jgi:hypothetical protein
MIAFGSLAKSDTNNERTLLTVEHVNNFIYISRKRIVKQGRLIEVKVNQQGPLSGKVMMAISGTSEQ